MPDYLIGNYWPFIINGPALVAQILIVAFGQDISQSKRIILGFGVTAAAMMIIPILANIGGATGFYLCNMVLMIFGMSFGVV